MGVAGHLFAPAERSAALAWPDYICRLQRLVVFRVCVGRLGSDREQSDNSGLEQSAAGVWKRSLVPRGATPGLLPPFVCRLVHAELHIVWTTSLGMASGRDLIACRRGRRGVLSRGTASRGTLAA